MLKVLVVDDEPKVRRGVSRLIAACPEKYELTGSCSNAEEVIGFLGKIVPDVIVTDICMPNQDGLELIKHLKHRYHNLDFIILSGYGDFEYAKKALQYRVFDFLLKPVNAQELYDALDGVCEKRKNNRVVRAESLEDNYFFNLIRASEEAEEKKNLEALGLYDREGGYRVAILDMGEAPEELRKGTGRLKELVCACLPEADYLYMCFGYQMILVWERELVWEELPSAVSQLAEHFGCRIYLGISRRSECYRDFKNVYFQALDAVKQYIYTRRGQVILSDRFPEEKKIVYSEEACEKIINAVKTGNEALTERMLDEFLDCYRENRCTILRLKRHLLLLQEVG